MRAFAKRNSLFAFAVRGCSCDSCRSGLALCAVHIDHVLEVLDEAQSAYGEEADCIKGEERSNDKLAGTDIGKNTHDAVCADCELDNGEVGEFLTEEGMLFTARFGGADERSFTAENCREPSAGVADGDSDAHGHQCRKGKHTGLPTGVTGATLGNEVERGRCDGCKENKDESDREEPTRHLGHWSIPGEKRVSGKSGKEHARVNRVVRRVQEGAKLFAERNSLCLEDERKILDGGLDGAFCPTELLSLECVDVVRKFGRDDDVEDELHLPAGELATVRKVHVFGQRIAFPTTSVHDGLFTPNACGTVEVHEKIAPAASGLFYDEVTIDTDRLGEGKTRFTTVQMAPAALYEADVFVHHEMRDGLEQEVFLRDEVGVEDGKIFALGDSHTGCECTRLEILTVGTMNEFDVKAFGLLFCDFALGDFVAFIGGVVQNLNFVTILRIVDGADSIDQTFHAVGFVEDRELCRDLRQVIHFVVAVELKKALAVGEANSAAVLQEKIDAPIAVESIDDKADAGDDVDDKEDIKDILSHNFKPYAFYAWRQI